MASSFVYGIGRRGEYVKFGYAANVRNRLSQIQVGCPVKLWILAETELTNSEMARETEGWIHKIVHKHITHGEWFAWNRETEHVVARLNAHDGRELRVWLRQELRKWDGDVTPNLQMQRTLNQVRDELDKLGAPAIRRRFQ